MLVGAAIAGALLWLATQFEATTAARYWTFVGLIAAAGLVLALSQLAGGWTKWGAPRVTGGAFLLGFLPALLVGGWVLLAAQPEGAWLQETAASWADELGAGGLLETMTAVLPAVALALGLLLGYSFDTTGARVVAAEPAPANDAARPFGRRVEDEPVTAERAAVEPDEERIEEEYREPDRGFVDSITGRDRRDDVAVHEGETDRLEHHDRTDRR